MAKDDAGPENKAERLALAAAVAPTLRVNAGKAKSRRVAVVDKDGNVTGYRTLAEVQEALLAAEKIAIAVDDGVRPKEMTCKFCGKPFPLQYATGNVPTKCGKCLKCAECAAPLRRNAMQPSKVRARHGQPARCGSCAAKHRNAGMTPEQRRDRARKAHAALTPADRSARARKGRASLTPEQRSEVGRKGAASRDPEDRKETARLANIASRVAVAARTPEHWQAAAQKAWATRRANAAAKVKAEA